MKKNKWFTVFVGAYYEGAEYIKIAEISSVGLLNLLLPKFTEVYRRQPVRVVPGKINHAPANIDAIAINQY